MNFEDLKLLALNSAALFVSFTKLEATLKIILLIVSIIYTIIKIKNLSNEKNR